MNTIYQKEQTQNKEKTMEYRIYEKIYENINGKIIKTIEENYLKDFNKEIKKFRIIMVGYNACPNKDLKAIEEYGWEMFPMNGVDLISYLFKKEISSKVSIELLLVKNDMKNGILVTGKLLSERGKRGYIKIKVDETDELFEQIKSLDKVVCFDTYNKFGNEILNYEIISRNEHGNGYTLRVSYPCSL